MHVNSEFPNLFFFGATLCYTESRMENNSLHIEGETGTETLDTDEHGIPVTRFPVHRIVAYDENQGTDSRNESGCMHAQSSTYFPLLM
jgi:hypothetical protein